jgi:hypothetical protein
MKNDNPNPKIADTPVDKYEETGSNTYTLCRAL